MRERSLSSLFPHLYHISFSKNYMMLDLLVGYENSVSFLSGSVVI